jgi:hypothetical protein
MTMIQAMTYDAPETIRPKVVRAFERWFANGDRRHDPNNRRSLAAELRTIAEQANEAGRAWCNRSIAQLTEGA